MPQKYLLFGLIVICFTILLFAWMVRDSLCELQLRKGNIELVSPPDTRRLFFRIHGLSKKQA